MNLKKYITKKGKDIPGLYRNEETGIFYARKRVGDKTPRVSLDTDIESTAILKLYDAIKEMEDDARKKSLSDAEREKEEASGNANKLFRDFYQMAIEEKERLEVRAATLRRINTIWKNNIEPFCGDLKPSEIIDQDRNFIDDFMKWHRKSRPGVQFINTFKYLGNVFRIMAERGAIPFDKIPKLELPKPESRHHVSKKGRIVQDEEFLSVHRSTAADYQLILSIAFYLGMRKMEIGSLRPEQVVLEPGEGYFFDFRHEDTKTGLERMVSIPEFLVKRVLDCKANCGGYFLFPSPQDSTKAITSKSIDYAWKVAKLAAKVPGRIRFHDLRHTRATAMVSAGENPLLISTHLGMTIQTLQKRYYHLKPKDLRTLNRSLVDLNERGDV